MKIQSVKTSQENNIHVPKNVDSEWLQLLLEAKAIGLSLEDIREFFEKTASEISDEIEN